MQISSNSSRAESGTALPHPHHEAGGMVSPRFLIRETKWRTERELTRFHLDFDLRDHFLPAFPATVLITTSLDLVAFMRTP